MLQISKCGISFYIGRIHFAGLSVINIKTKLIELFYDFFFIFTWFSLSEINFLLFKLILVWFLKWLIKLKIMLTELKTFSFEFK